MPAAPADPYRVLGVTSQASDAELRAAYRRLAQLHHPDHNQGSLEATRRFEAVQAAYLRALELRRSAATSGPQASTAGGPAANSTIAADPAVDERIAAMERELAEARRAREQAQRAAAQATSPAGPDGRRPTPEELGYVTTDDSISKILDDAQAELAQRLSEATSSPLAKRLADLLRVDKDD